MAQIVSSETLDYLTFKNPALMKVKFTLSEVWQKLAIKPNADYLRRQGDQKERGQESTMTEVNIIKAYYIHM